jgi:hypothetical protein
MSARVIIAELARTKRPIPCADERYTACPFFEAKSFSERGAMSVGQVPSPRSIRPIVVVLSPVRSATFSVSFLQDSAGRRWSDCPPERRRDG